MSTAAVASTAKSCSRLLVKPASLLAPVVVAAYAACRYKDENFGKCCKSSGAQKNLTKSPVVVCESNLSAYPKLSSSTSCQGAELGKSSLSFRDKPQSHLSAASASFLGGHQDEISHTTLPRRSRSLTVPRAAYKDAFSIRYPVITEKPEWWWRTLACIPYLLALQISDAGYFIQPLLDRYQICENLIYFVPGAITRLPVWFSMAYCYFAYLWIARNKEWPHFFRFHLMMGLLLETSLQLIWHVGNFFPLIHYNGMFGMHFWAAVGFAFIIILLQCIRCALAGMYAHVPFISDAAYIHTLFNVGGFHRFF